MTNQVPGEHDERWQQPPFTASEPAEPTPAEPPVVQGQLLVPAVSTPPSVAETVLGSVAGIVWPVMIVLAIFSVVGWVQAIVVAIVASAALGAARNHLKARRKALGRDARPRPDERQR